MSNRATSGRSGAVVDLLDVVGDWAAGSGPLYRRLARAVTAAIERGALRDGDRLPSERHAAGALAIGRGTAVAAYDVLVADGLLQRRRGSGTYVRVTDQPPLPPGREGSALVHRLVERSEPGVGPVDLSISVLRDADGLPDVAVTTDDLRRVVPDTGYSPWGLPVLREAIARHLADTGLPTTAEQVVVTTGAQQAISAAAACWIRPGDRVVVDDPTYPGALAAFTQAGADLVGVPVDEHGVRVDALAAALDRRPALVYVQSSPHSPTGVRLSARRRGELAALVTARRVPFVEDLALSALSWVPVDPPAAARAPDAAIAVVGSLSKLFWGGLRIGFVRAPEPLALRFARVKATQDLGSSAPSQLLAAALLSAPGLGEWRRRRVDALRARHDVLAAELRRRLPAWSFAEPTGGLSLWVDIGRPAEPFAQLALRYGVAVATPGALAVTTAHEHRVRLSFAGPPDELVEGVARLAAAWRARG